VRNLGCILVLILWAPNAALAEESPAADILIKNALVVTMDSKQKVIPRGTLIIKGNKILAVGGPELADTHSALKVIDADGDIVMPGMVNTHTHAPMTIFRGLADEVPDRLQRFIFPLERTVVDPDSVYRGTLLAAVEMVQGGVTTFADMYYFEDQVARAAKRVGMRAVAGETVIKFPAPDAKEPYGGLEYALEFIDDFKGDELITPALAPHAPYSVDTEHLETVGKLARELQVPVLIHLSETRGEIAQIDRDFGKTPVEYLDSVGLLSSQLVAAHCIFVTDSDIALLKERRVGVAHNMVSNVKAGKGVAPALEMLDQGIDIGLGTDGAMSGNTLDIITQMGYVAKIHKLMKEDRSIMPPVKVVEMGTIGGARALKMADRIGSLEPGKLADVVIVDKDAVNMIPMYDVYSALVYAATAANVTTTIIHGRIIMEDRKIKTVDVEQIKRDVLELNAKIRARASEL
jgi:cytosine/adenosine deaminase-related metal-dependent hydrolase